MPPACRRVEVAAALHLLRRVLGRRLDVQHHQLLEQRHVRRARLVVAHHAGERRRVVPERREHPQPKLDREVELARFELLVDEEGEHDGDHRLPHDELVVPLAHRRRLRLLLLLLLLADQRDQPEHADDAEEAQHTRPMRVARLDRPEHRERLLLGGRPRRRGRGSTACRPTRSHCHGTSKSRTIDAVAIRSSQKLKLRKKPRATHERKDGLRGGRWP